VINKIDFAAKNLTSNAGLFLLFEKSYANHLGYDCQPAEVFKISAFSFSVG
jgi:hypothetical protein